MNRQELERWIRAVGRAGVIRKNRKEALYGDFTESCLARLKTTEPVAATTGPK